MSDRDRDAIRKVFEETYAENVRTRNLDGYTNVYTEHAIYLPPDAPDTYGKAAIQAGFSDKIADQEIHPVFTTEEIEVYGNFGYVLGICNATVYPNDGSPTQQVKFRALWLMKKEDGQWKIHRQMWNNKPANE